ncbi:nucleotide exchange factor GrpE [Natrialbaceae archaeon A-CW1-1]
MLAMTHEGSPQLVPTVSDEVSIPSQLGISESGIQIGDDIKETNEETIVVDPFTSFENRFDSGEDIALDELPAVNFLEKARSEWGMETDKEGHSDKLPGIVSIPGACDVGDEKRFLTTIKAAGFDTINAIREPLPIAYDAGLHQKKDGTYVVIRIGSYWLDAAIIEPRPDSDKVETISRLSLADRGANLFNRTLAHWLSENEHEGVSDMTHQEIKEEIRIHREELNENKSVILIDNNGVSISEAVLDRALEGVVAEVGTALRKMLTDATLTPDEIDGVLVSGSGSGYSVIRRTIKGTFQARVRHVGCDEPWDDASARGASLIGSIFGSDVEKADTTLRRTFVIETLGPNGAEYSTVFSGGQTITGVQRATLCTTEDDQTRAQFRIGARHRATGEVDEIGAFEVSGLPAAPAGEISVNIELKPKDSEPTDCRCEAKLHEDLGISPTELTVSSLSTVNKERPLFMCNDLNLNEIDVPDRERYEPAYKREPTAEAYESLSPKQAVDRFIDIRNELWTATKSNSSLSSSELAVRVKKLDVGLQHAGINLIEPEEGEPVNDQVHRIDAMRETTQPEGTIVELRKPGYKVDADVVAPARVVVSEGPPNDGKVNENAEGSEEVATAPSDNKRSEPFNKGSTDPVEVEFDSTSESNPDSGTEAVEDSNSFTTEQTDSISDGDESEKRSNDPEA